MPKKTLISIISNRDPHFDGFLMSQTEKRGPLLALLEAEYFNKVVILTQPYLKKNGIRTKIAIG